jgi:sugar phosphate isomerase/epimerase
MNRKEFLKGLAAGAALPFAGCYSSGLEMPQARNAHLNLAKVFGPAGAKGNYHVFSKMFQFLDYDKCAELLAKAGATGIEWTVRKGGHVTPERVKTDLPKAVEAARAHGLKSDMMVVSYTGAEDPGAEDVFKTAADCGVRQFRPGYYDYRPGETAMQMADRVKASFDSYVKLGERTGLRSVHHNHNTVGGTVRFGGLIWDMWSVMKDYDPKYVSFEFDPMRAIRETGASWRAALTRVATHIGAVCLKDFKLEPSEDPLAAKEVLVAAGVGVMPWADVKAALDAAKVEAPFVLHYEWPFPKDGDLAATVKTELKFFKGVFG